MGARPLALGDLSQTRCLLCGGRSLTPVLLAARDGAPPGSPEHQIVYRHRAVVRCDGCGGGFVELRRHDCFDFEEVFDQDEWFTFDAAGGAELLARAATCAEPLLESCTCALHAEMRGLALPSGAWATSLEQQAHVHRVRFVARSDQLAVEEG